MTNQTHDPLQPTGSAGVVATIAVQGDCEGFVDGGQIVDTAGEQGSFTRPRRSGRGNAPGELVAKVGPFTLKRTSANGGRRYRQGV